MNALLEPLPMEGLEGDRNKEALKLNSVSFKINTPLLIYIFNNMY